MAESPEPEHAEIYNPAGRPGALPGREGDSSDPHTRDRHARMVGGRHLLPAAVLLAMTPWGAHLASRVPPPSPQLLAGGATTR